MKNLNILICEINCIIKSINRSFIMLNTKMENENTSFANIVLTLYLLILQSYGNQSIIVICKAIHWSLYGMNIAGWRVQERSYLKDWDLRSNKIFLKTKLICDALRDLVPFVQFKKRENHPLRSVAFSKELQPATLLKVALLNGYFPRFLNCTNGIISRNASHLTEIISNILALSDPSISESCIQMKINLNFYFDTSLWCLKRLYEGLYGLHKIFWGTTKTSEYKNLS